jgi:leucyl/phenylalanyl-tRNA--protein transferase
MIKLKFTLIDCQVYTTHLASLGGRFVTRETFTSLIKKSLRITTLRGDWASHPEISATLLRPDFLTNNFGAWEEGR